MEQKDVYISTETSKLGNPCHAFVHMHVGWQSCSGSRCHEPQNHTGEASELLRAGPDCGVRRQLRCGSHLHALLAHIGASLPVPPGPQWRLIGEALPSHVAHCNARAGGRNIDTHGAQWEHIGVTSDGYGVINMHHGDDCHAAKGRPVCPSHVHLFCYLCITSVAYGRQIHCACLHGDARTPPP